MLERARSGYFRFLALDCLHVLNFEYALRCTTLHVVGITTRSVVQLSLPSQVFTLDDSLGRVLYFEIGTLARSLSWRTLPSIQMLSKLLHRLNCDRHDNRSSNILALDQFDFG